MIRASPGLNWFRFLEFFKNADFHDLRMNSLGTLDQILCTRITLGLILNNLHMRQ